MFHGALGVEGSAMKFQLEPHHRDVPDSELLADLRSVADRLGAKTVTIDQFNEYGRYHGSTLARRFGSWFKALDAAGLEPSRRLNITESELFENLSRVWLTLGRQPKYSDADGPLSTYSASTYANRFGGWRKSLEIFVDWANGSEFDEPGMVKKPREKGKATTRNINWRLRALVLMRDGARCQLCGADVASGAKLHVDHIVPWSKGGETDLDNLQILCETCNIGKSDQPMPQSAGR